VPPSERTSQPSLKSRPSLGAAPSSDLTPSTAADNLAAAVVKIADDAAESVTDGVQASIGAEGASKVKVLIEQVGDLVNARPGGNGSGSGSHQGLMEHFANAGGDLVQASGGMLGGLLGREDGAPIPDNDNLAVQPLAAFYYDYEQTSTELMGRTAAAVGELAQAVGRVINSSGGVAPNQVGVPATPAAPPPVPAAPPVLPLAYSSSLLVASGTAADAFQSLFAVLALFSIALLQGGRLSWLRRESHGPPTAVVLAIERPG
jgi:hypothetical protein